MTQNERRAYLIDYLLNERKGYEEIEAPSDVPSQKQLLRSLFNVRLPAPIDEEFLKVQDEYLQQEISDMGITDCRDIPFVKDRLCLWQGDITTLKIDAIVNAANSGLTGCYRPLHNCIDNCIHTFSGVQLRCDCAKIIERQGHEEETGRAKITKAYNLPSKYVLHTVGPIVRWQVSDEDEALLKSCYTSCLNLAREHGVKSIAFPCISTGVFGYPKQPAAKAAILAVTEFLKQDNQIERVVFNVFSDEDRLIYEKLLSG